MVTGTGTGVGKTVVAAAVAALARQRGSRVAVVKPAQTGVTPEEPADLAEISRLSGVTDVHEYARYPDPLSPEAAARRSGRAGLDLGEVAGRIHDLAATHDLVLVEGAGGLLVRFADDGWTLADLTRLLRAELLVVAEAGLGALNATALTLEVVAGRGLRLSGLVIGSWPARPDLACRSNVGDLERLAGRPLAGALPAAASAAGTSGTAGTPGTPGTPGTRNFLDLARHGLGTGYGGAFNPADFRAAVLAPTDTVDRPDVTVTVGEGVRG